MSYFAKHFDVVSIGDCVVDTFLTLNNPNEYCHIEKAHHELCIKSGAKVMVDDAQFLLGGNACNVSVGLSRLGVKTALLAEIGDDAFSQKILQGLKEEDVYEGYIKQNKNAPSTFSVVLNILGERTLFVRHVERDHSMKLENFSAKFLYLSSLGRKWQGLYERALFYAKKNSILLAFNPGTTQLQDKGDMLTKALEMTDILFVNREEAELLVYGKPCPPEDKETIENLLFRLQRLGPKMVVMTDGNHGGYAMGSDAKVQHCPPMPCTMVEKTGAGDAYAAGFLGALLLGKSVEEALQWGAAESASVIEHVGAQPGLLTMNGLKHRLSSL